MNKVVVASLLALSAVALAPGSRVAFAQNQVNLGTGAQGGAIEMPAAEANAYNNVMMDDGETSDPEEYALTDQGTNLLKENV